MPLAFHSHNKWSSQQRCSIRKAFLKNVATFTKKYLCWTLFLINLQGSTTLLKGNSNKGVFLWILRTFQNTFFEEHLPTAVSVVCHWYRRNSDLLYFRSVLQILKHFENTPETYSEPCHTSKKEYFRYLSVIGLQLLIKFKPYQTP